MNGNGAILSEIYLNKDTCVHAWNPESMYEISFISRWIVLDCYHIIGLISILIVLYFIRFNNKTLDRCLNNKS